MNNPASFTSYLRAGRFQDDAIADFAADWLDDAKRPRGRYGWNAVAAHLRAAGATDEAITTARLAWEDYTCCNSPADSLPMLLELSGLVHSSAIYTTTTDLFGVETRTPTPAMNDVIRKLRRSIASFFVRENGTNGTGLKR
jgi:hypothetical protein